MPPPPTPFAHRRSHRLITPPSPPSSLDDKTCLPKMSLHKGATFHYSSSSSEEDPTLSIPHLSRRSPTCSSAFLASWLADKQDVAQSIADFEETFSGARGKRHYARRRSAQNFEQQVRAHRASLPADEGLGSSISSTSSDKELSQNFARALDLISDKDSGLGTSIADQESAHIGRTSEEDGLTKDLIQGWLVRCLSMCSFVDHIPAEANSSAPLRRTRQQTAVTQSIAPPTTKISKKQPSLSRVARKKISQSIIDPILEEARFEEFRPLVSSLGNKANKAIRCLRDLEQSLIFQPLVSILLSHLSIDSDFDPSKTLSVSQNLYRTFGEFSIQLVVDTYHQLSESDQRRASDRPYDNGYFLDLVQQVGRLASQVGRRRNSVTGSEEDDEMAYSPGDEVTVEGGLATTGDVAELVRWKKGKGISLRTGLPYEPTPGIKREASSLLDDDVARSMARRKKGYIPEYVEMKCSDPDCDKIFTRKCDLSKHEKTHSRPFKCPEPTCKYHEQGLPTEKERDRHINDKHDPNPHFYKCNFCEFRTKRESNCKQHMEKKHNWMYERAKGKEKGGRMTPAQTPQTPSMDYSSGMQSPAMSYMSSHWDDGSSIAGSLAGSAQLTPYDQTMQAFDFNQAPTYSAPLFPRDNQAMNYQSYDYNQQYHGAYISPTNTHPMTPHQMTTPVTPAYSNITGQSPYLPHVDMNMDCVNPNTYDTSLPTPESFLQPHSRNPSISHQSPMTYDMGNNNFDDPMIGQSVGIPDNDFALFRGDNTCPFSNPAAASATLFPSAAEFSILDNDPILFDDEGFGGDYSMTN